MVEIAVMADRCQIVGACAVRITDRRYLLPTKKGRGMAALSGTKLPALLGERGMSQRELAEAAGLTPASVSRYVNGEREPRAPTIAALADVLGVSPSDIIGTPDEQELDTAIRLVARNADRLSEAQRAVLIAALAKR